MSNCNCEQCGAEQVDTPCGYQHGCQHYPAGVPKQERGILYFLAAQGRRGGKHAVQLAISLYTLRRSHKGTGATWDGPVHIMCGDNEAYEVASRLCEADQLQRTTCQRVAYDPSKTRAYAAKTLMGEWSPFKLTVYADTDTVFVGDIKEVWPLGDEIVFTRFCEWHSGGNIIRGRIKKWREYAPYSVEAALRVARPAINTGIVGYSESTKFFEPWKALCAKCPKMFLGDETAAQVLLATEQEWRCVDSRFNRSPHFEEITDDCRVLHFHGQKCLTAKGAPYWLPHFREACSYNYAKINDWYPRLFPELAKRMTEEACLSTS